MAKQNGQTPAPLEPTPATVFRKEREAAEQGIPLELPATGRVVLVRTVTPEQLLRFGKIPDILTSLVLKMIYDGVKDEDVKTFLLERPSAEETMQMVETLRIVCTAALVYPRIVDDPQADDEIHITDLSLDERGWIFRLVFHPAEILTNFRLEPLGDVEPVLDGDEVKQPA